MQNRRIALICLSLVLFIAGGLVFGLSPVHAQRICTTTVKSRPNAPRQRVDLCEQDGQTPDTGNPQFISDSPSRFIVVMDCGDPTNVNDRNNPANWSDVVRIFQSEGSEAQLLSKGSTFFPLPTTVLAANNTVFISETKTGQGVDDAITDDTIYDDGVNEFHIHSAAALGCPPAQVPEGDTLMLVGTGLAGLLGYAGLRWRAGRRATSSRTRGGAEG